MKTSHRGLFLISKEAGVGIPKRKKSKVEKRRIRKRYETANQNTKESTMKEPYMHFCCYQRKAA